MAKKRHEEVAVPEWEFDQEITVLIDQLSQEPGSLLRCLQRIQDHFGYVPESGIPVIARLCNVSKAETFGVLTYYSDLVTEPPAQVTVRLCAAEACQAVGSRELESEWEDLCTGEFAGESVATKEVFCLGNCALGPAAMVNSELLGRATAHKIESLVSSIVGGS